MKLFEIATKYEEDIKNLVRRPIPMSLLGPENCLVTIEPVIKKREILRSFIQVEHTTEIEITFRLHIDLFLDTLTLRKEIFQEIADGTIHHLKQRGLFNIPDSMDVYMSMFNIDLYLDKFKLPLFNFINVIDVLPIKAPRQIEELMNGTKTYTIDQSVLPRIDLDYNKEHNRREERAKNIYKAFRKGKVDGTSYILPEDYKLDVVYNKDKFNFDDNIIKPHFDVIIRIYSDDIEIPNSPTNTNYHLLRKVHDKFQKFDVILQYS